MDYQAQILQRCQNPHLKQRLSQVAIDGNQKLPHRLFHPVTKLIEVASLPSSRYEITTKCVAFVTASWMHYHVENGRGFLEHLDGNNVFISDLVKDPLKNEIQVAVAHR